MIGEDLVKKVKQYRLAVDAYCDAVGRMASTGDLGQEWQQIEVARDEAEQAWCARLTTSTWISARARPWP